MNKYKKIGLTALAGSLVAGSVSAAELSAQVQLQSTTAVEMTTKSLVTVGQWLTLVTFSASGDVNDIGVTLSLRIRW